MKIINYVQVTLFLFIPLFSVVAIAQDITTDSVAAPADSTAAASSVANEFTYDQPESGADAGFGDSAGEAEVTPGVFEYMFSGKYLVFLILSAVGLILLINRAINRWVRIGMMFVAFFLLGIEAFTLSGTYLGVLVGLIGGVLLIWHRKRFLWVGLAFVTASAVFLVVDLITAYNIQAYPMHPSPICATTKLFMFKITRGIFFPGLMAGFLAIMIPSLIGRKLFCGWVCPLGAFQELINKLPFKFRWKYFNFTVFNSIRLGLLALFFITFFGVRSHVFNLGQNLQADTAGDMWIGYSNYSVYDPVNYFEFFHEMSYVYERTLELVAGQIPFSIWWSLIGTDVTTLFFIMMVIIIAASLLLYRPFCYAVCPIGALTWLAEKIAPLRIRVDAEKCTECGICDDESPCPTIRPLRERQRGALPDCTSCGECVRSCPEDAISFRFGKIV